MLFNTLRYGFLDKMVVTGLWGKFIGFREVSRYDLIAVNGLGQS